MTLGRKRLKTESPGLPQGCPPGQRAAGTLSQSCAHPTTPQPDASSPARPRKTAPRCCPEAVLEVSRDQAHMWPSCARIDEGTQGRGRGSRLSSCFILVPLQTLCSSATEGLLISRRSPMLNHLVLSHVMLGNASPAENSSTSFKAPPCMTGPRRPWSEPSGQQSVDRRGACGQECGPMRSAPGLPAVL